MPVVGAFMVEQAMNSGRAAARGFGVVSREAAALRAPEQRFTRANVAGLVRGCRGSLGAVILPAATF